MIPRTAMVTGASEGIGRAFAVRLARAGYRVTAVARNAQRLDELLSELGHGHRRIVADLSQASDVGIVSEELSLHHYELLVNNAGMGVDAPFEVAPLGRLQEMMRINCDAVVSLAHTFLNHSRRGDALLNVSSTLAYAPCAGSAVYCATKSFVSSFSDALWMEQRSRGVFVASLCPGATDTGFGGLARGTGGLPPAEDFHRDRASKNGMSPESVVEAAVRAIALRKSPRVIPGWRNRAASFVLPLLPLRWLEKVFERGTIKRTPNRASPRAKG